MLGGGRAGAYIPQWLARSALAVRVRTAIAWARAPRTRLRLAGTRLSLRFILSMFSRANEVKPSALVDLRRCVIPLEGAMLADHFLNL